MGVFFRPSSHLAVCELGILFGHKSSQLATVLLSLRPTKGIEKSSKPSCAKTGDVTGNRAAIGANKMKKSKNQKAKQRKNKPSNQKVALRSSGVLLVHEYFWRKVYRVLRRDTRLVEQQLLHAHS